MMIIRKEIVSIVVFIYIVFAIPSISSAYLMEDGFTQCFADAVEGNNKTMSTMLFHGLFSNDMEMVKTAVARGADLNSVASCSPSLYTTPLLFAIYKENMPLFQYLLSQGASVDFMRRRNQTPLASLLDGESHQIEFIKALVEAGARITNVRWTGQSAIELAAKWREDSNARKQNKRQVLKYLISKGANANSGRFCLPLISATQHLADESTDFTTLKMLMDAGADPNLKYIPKPDDAPSVCDNISAVDVAIRTGNKALIKYMLPYSR